MSTSKEQVLRRVIDCGVVAIIRTNAPEPLLDIARALLAGGVTAIEVTMTTPGALRGIRLISDALGDQIVLGVGTVLNARTCRDAVAAGAQFVVSPGFDDAVHSTASDLGVASMPGAFTPTEIIRAWTAGADVVKVFPATTLGPGYFRDVLAPLPHVKLMPTGGVEAANIADWIRAGAVCIGAGSNLVPKAAVAKGDWSQISANASAYVQAVKAARSAS